MQKRVKRRLYSYPSSCSSPVIKLKRAVGVRGAYSPLAAWKIMPPNKQNPHSMNNHSNFRAVDDSPQHENSTALIPSKGVSARKLAASLWELQGASAMKKSSGKDSSYHSSRPPRDKDSRPPRDKERDRERLSMQLPQHLSDPSYSPSPLQATITNGGHRRQVSASLKHQHALTERNIGALQALTPGSCSSSIEVGAIDQAVTPTSSLDLKIRPRDSGVALATSTELLKVLNRIWSLEEQHSSSMSMVRALRIELDHARERIHELLQEQKADRHQIESLTKRFADERMAWKSNDHEKVRAAVQSVRDELEDERKLRRRSESLHRKLARELAEIKTAFAKVFQDLEKEKKARELVEDFCDELVIEVGKGDANEKTAKQDLDKVKGESERVLQLLNIAELWKEERVRMKIAAARFEVEQKEKIMERLRTEMQAFLKNRRDTEIQNGDGDNQPYRQSLESMHLNCNSAPQDAGDEESVDSDMHSIEFNRNNVDDNNMRGYRSRFTSVGLNESRNRRSCEQNLSFQQENKGQRFLERKASIEEHTGNGKYSQSSKAQLFEKLKAGQINHTGMVDDCSEADQDSNDSTASRNDLHANGKNLKHVSETLARTQSIQSECSGIKECPENTADCYPSQTSWRSLGGGIDHLLGTSIGPVNGLSSPTRQWNHVQLSSDPGRLRNSSDRSKGTRENSLKAKLLEARLEGQQARLRNARGL